MVLNHMQEQEQRIKLGIVGDEFFDPALGRMGGFGWVVSSGILA